jgi:hypothetical protein
MNNQNMPQDLQLLLTNSFWGMKNHPQKHLIPLQRDIIYKTFFSKLQSNSLLAWISFLSAKKTLQILQNAIGSKRSTPTELSDIAEQALTRIIDTENDIFRNTLDRAYHASGHSWGCNPQKFPLEADFAGAALYRTLQTIDGKDPFWLLRCNGHKGYKVHFNGRTKYVCLDEHLTDDMFFEPIGAVEDASSLAAKAFSFTVAIETDELDIVPQYDFNKRQEFWEWWLIEAIPIAWEQANQYR